MVITKAIHVCMQAVWNFLNMEEEATARKKNLLYSDRKVEEIVIHNTWLKMFKTKNISITNVYCIVLM